MSQVHAQVQVNKAVVDSKLNAIEFRLAEMNSNQEGMKHMMEDTHKTLMQLLGKGNGKSPLTMKNSRRGNGLLPRPNRQAEAIGSGPNQDHEFHPELQFLNYGGAETRTWLRRCNRHFKIYRILDPVKKLEMATLHMEGDVEA